MCLPILHHNLLFPFLYFSTSFCISLVFSLYFSFRFFVFFCLFMKPEDFSFLRPDSYAVHISAILLQPVHLPFVHLLRCMLIYVSFAPHKPGGNHENLHDTKKPPAEPFSFVSMPPSMIRLVYICYAASSFLVSPGILPSHAHPHFTINPPKKKAASISS